MNIILSIIIVTYLSEEEILACIESIPKKINKRPVEIIVVENDSGDNIESVVRVFDHVQFINHGVNYGFGKANNIGFEASIGEYILFLNPDTIVNSEALEHCINQIQNDIKIGFITPKLEMLNGEMDLACRRSIPTIWDGFCRSSGLAKYFPSMKLFSRYNLTYLPENESYEVDAVNGAFMMTSRKTLSRIGLFDEQYFMYGDDLDLCYRSKISGYKNIYDGTVSITHLKGQSSSKVFKKMSQEVFKGTLQFYEKFFNPHNSLIVSLKYKLLFGAWAKYSKLKSKVTKHSKAQPV